MPIFPSEDLTKRTRYGNVGLLVAWLTVEVFCLPYCSVIVAGNNVNFASGIFLKRIFSPVDRQTDWEGFITCLACPVAVRWWKYHPRFVWMFFLAFGPSSLMPLFKQWIMNKIVHKAKAVRELLMFLLLSWPV